MVKQIQIRMVGDSPFGYRGFLIESKSGPVWLWGTSAEHNVLYDYQVSHASNVFMGVIQHETAYYQGNPNALSPYTSQTTYTDPTFAECTQSNCARTWALRVIDSTNVFLYGGGLYNFFDNWSSACLDREECQERMIDGEKKNPSSPRIYRNHRRRKSLTYPKQYKTAQMSTCGPLARRDRLTLFRTRHTLSCHKQVTRTRSVRRLCFSRRRIYNPRGLGRGRKVPAPRGSMGQRAG